jgi:membrane-bound serine protease (ClpP class)
MTRSTTRRAAPRRRERATSRPRALSLLALALAVAAVLPTSTLTAGEGRPVVYVARVEGTIDLGLAPFVTRVLDEAAAARAAVLVLEVDTFGGRVDAAVVIRDALLRSPVRSVAFVNKRAISAGALIALASETVVMAEGATIGAATPVLAGEPGAPPQEASEKTVSYLRKEFAATAEARGRPALLAEAMVDADVEVPGVIARGKLLTLTTSEALEHRIADRRAGDLAAALASLGLSGAELRRPSPSWAEELLRLLTGTVVSSLLLTIGVLGIVTEIRTPGFGAAGIVGVLALALFFYGHALVYLVGWEEVVLIGAGLVLLALEVFVIPGFGVAGVLGIAALVGGLALSLVGAGASWESVAGAAAQVAVSLALAVLGAALLVRLLPLTPFARSVVLASRPTSPLAPDTAAPPGAARAAALVGRRGIALSALRTSGAAEFDGERVDVVSDGAFIDAGEPVEGLRVEGDRLVVRRVRGPAPG